MKRVKILRLNILLLLFILTGWAYLWMDGIGASETSGIMVDTWNKVVGLTAWSENENSPNTRSSANQKAAAKEGEPSSPNASDGRGDLNGTSAMGMSKIGTFAGLVDQLDSVQDSSAKLTLLNGYLEQVPGWISDMYVTARQNIEKDSVKSSFTYLGQRLPEILGSNSSRDELRKILDNEINMLNKKIELYNKLYDEASDGVKESYQELIKQIKTMRDQYQTASKKLTYMEELHVSHREEIFELVKYYEQLLKLHPESYAAEKISGELKIIYNNNKVNMDIK